MSDGKKPWEETWEVDADHPHWVNRREAGIGGDIGTVGRFDYGPTAYGARERANLAATAPRLYRALEALMGLKGLSGCVGSTEEWSEAMAALKAARGEE